MKRRRILEEKNPVELVEEAFHLLRRDAGPALALYYLGTLPFGLALLYFWSDMARSPFAEANLLMETLGITALFVWMKAWHGVFAQQLLARLCGETAPALTPARWAGIALRQAIVQPVGLFLIAIALPLLVPLGWVYAFFTNATVFAGGAPDLKTLVARSWRQARLWPMQSHYVLFTFKLFGLFVFLNLNTAILAVPFLMKILLGVETVFTRSPWAAFNTTLLTGTAMLAFLCIDPWLKAVYVLRCFYGQSLQTGQDLKADLKAFATKRSVPAAALLLLLAQLALAPGLSAAGTTSAQRPGTAAPNAITAPALDRSIEEVIRQREYSWRVPRDAAPKRPADKGENIIERLFKQIGEGLKAVGRWVRDFINWLDSLGRRPNVPKLGAFNLAAAMKGILFVLLVFLIALIVWLLVRVWLQRSRFEEIPAQALSPAPDVADENVGADQLPEDGWMRLSRELLERGELRLALRALYLATLAHLAGRNLIILAKFKSNCDYQRELGRRAHALPEVTNLFSHNVSDFERVWYGLHEVTPALLDQFQGNVEKLRTHA